MNSETLERQIEKSFSYKGYAVDSFKIETKSMMLLDVDNDKLDKGFFEVLDEFDFDVETISKNKKGFTVTVK